MGEQEEFCFYNCDATLKRMVTWHPDRRKLRTFTVPDDTFIGKDKIRLWHFSQLWYSQENQQSGTHW